MLTPMEPLIVGVTADCDDALFVNEIVITVSALFTTVCPPATVKTKVPELCVQAPAEPNLPAAAPATVNDPELPVCVPVNPTIVILSLAANAKLGLNVKVMVLATPCIVLDSAIVLVVNI